MSSKNLRLFFRYAHLVEGALIAAFIYSPTLQGSSFFAGLIQFVILPALIISGVAMWQFPRLNKWRNGRKRASLSS